jgi:small-conductance mechanosensitive channel
LYVLIAVRAWFGPELGLPIQACVILLLILAAWGSIRDVLSGIVIKTTATVRVGDFVRVGNVEGRLRSLGFRVLTLERADGAEAVVPYSQATGGLLERLRSNSGSTSHQFRLEVHRPNSTVSDVQRIVRERALLSHWSPSRTPPRVHPVGLNEYEVTVNALSPEHGTEIERAVRQDPAFQGPTENDADV